MIVGFIGSQSGLTNFQETEIEKVIKQLGCDEFASGDYYGSEEQVLELAEKIGIKIFSIFPVDDIRKRSLVFDKAKATKNIRINTPFVQVDDKQVRWFASQPYTASKKSLIDHCEKIIACPKEFTFSHHSATWKAISYVRHAKKDCIIIPPLVRSTTYSEDETM